MRTPDLRKLAGSARAIPKEIPFLAMFDKVVQPEWESPARPKSNHPIISKFYMLVPDVAECFRIPLVDDPVVSLCSSFILPTEADGLPRDPCARTLEHLELPSEPL